MKEWKKERKKAEKGKNMIDTENLLFVTQGLFVSP